MTGRYRLILFDKTVATAAYARGAIDAAVGLAEKEKVPVYIQESASEHEWIPVGTATPKRKFIAYRASAMYNATIHHTKSKNVTFRGENALVEL